MNFNEELENFVKELSEYESIEKRLNSKDTEHLVNDLRVLESKIQTKLKSINSKLAQRFTNLCLTDSLQKCIDCHREKKINYQEKQEDELPF